MARIRARGVPVCHPCRERAQSGATSFASAWRATSSRGARGSLPLLRLHPQGPQARGQRAACAHRRGARSRDQGRRRRRLLRARLGRGRGHRRAPGAERTPLLLPEGRARGSCDRRRDVPRERHAAHARRCASTARGSGFAASPPSGRRAAGSSSSRTACRPPGAARCSRRSRGSRRSSPPRVCSRRSASAPCPASRASSASSPALRAPSSTTSAASRFAAAARASSSRPRRCRDPSAVESICRALSQLQRVRGVDVIVLGRGGGSADDLSAFNEEAIVRAVRRLPRPDRERRGPRRRRDARRLRGRRARSDAVAGRGDGRARPTGAAASCSGARACTSRARCTTASRTAASRTAASRGRLGDPRLAIAAHQQTLDDRLARLVARARSVDCPAPRRPAPRRAAPLVAPPARDPGARAGRADPPRPSPRDAAGAPRSRGAATELHRAAARLDAFSPLKVLARGYAIATREDGRAIRTGDDVAPGQKIHLRVRDARLDARVESVEPIEPGPSPARTRT